MCTEHRYSLVSELLSVCLCVSMVYLQIVAFLVLRNVSPFARSTHNAAISLVGRISLEVSIYTCMYLGLYRTVPYILYNTIPCYTIQYHTILYNTIYHTVPYCTILYYTVLYYTVLYCTILYHYILLYTLQYKAQSNTQCLKETQYKSLYNCRAERRGN